MVNLYLIKDISVRGLLYAWFLVLGSALSRMCVCLRLFANLGRVDELSSASLGDG